MNFYKRYPADYARKTARLSLIQHGAYCLLLDEVYTSEAPLPGPFDELFRICRAMSKAEQTAVRIVADKFFPLGQDGLRRNSRADEEIEEAAPAIEAAKANGRKGGRPKKETQTKPAGFPKANPNETQREPSSKAPQSSDNLPPLREGKARKRATLAKPSDISQQVWDDFLALRAKKRADVSETTLAEARREADKAAIPLERFLTIWCLRGSQGLQASWLTNDERGATRVPNLAERRIATLAGLTNPGIDHGSPDRTVEVEARVIG